MGYLDKLLDGAAVEWMKIKDVAEVGTGRSNGNEAQEGGLYPFFIRSQIVKAKNDWQFNEEAIIIPGEGGIGEIYHYINGKYALHQRVYRIHFTTNRINAKFAYYYLKTSFLPFITKKAVSATVKSIRKPMIEQFEIPIPCPDNPTKSLEIQNKIVDILDKFTELEAELEAELEVRRKQYEYYRDNLLNFSNLNGGGI